MKDAPVYYPDMRQMAVFLDIDNLPQYANANVILLLLNALKPWGKVIIRRAYGAALSKKSHLYRNLLENKFEIAEVNSSAAHRRNGTDIRIALEIIELIHNRPGITTFVMASGDGDFLEVVHRLHEYQRCVIGVGSKKSSSYELTKACDTFIYYENLVEATKPLRDNQDIATCSKPLKSTPEEMRTVLRKLDFYPPDPCGRHKILKKLVNIPLEPSDTFSRLQEKLIQACEPEGISRSAVRHTLHSLLRSGLLTKTEQPIDKIPEFSVLEKSICQVQLEFLLSMPNIVADPMALSEAIWGDASHAVEIEKILLEKENPDAVPSENCLH